MNCDGCQYDFLYWYASSSREHDSNLFLYTVPNWSETVTAFYQLQTSTTSASTTTTVTVSSTASSQTASPDFALSASPSSVSLPPNNYLGSVGFTLALSSVSGWTGPVQLTASALPAGVTLSNLPLSYQLGAGGAASWTIFVNISPSAPAGTYQLVITGLSGSLVHSAAVTITVSSPSTAVPEFPQSTLGVLAVCLAFVPLLIRRSFRRAPCLRRNPSVICAVRLRRGHAKRALPALRIAALLRNKDADPKARWRLQDECVQTVRMLPLDDRRGFRRRESRVHLTFA